MQQQVEGAGGAVRFAEQPVEQFPGLGTDAGQGARAGEKGIEKRGPHLRGLAAPPDAGKGAAKSLALALRRGKDRGRKEIPVVRMSSLSCAVFALLALCLPARALDRVAFASNWLAEAEHGGFYQALADGTYARYGLDVTILPGGPQKNNRLLLAAGKVDFYMGDNLIGEFSALAENIPIVTVAAIFQKDPLVFMSHPGAGLDRFEDLPKAKAFVGLATLTTVWPWMEKKWGFSRIMLRPIIQLRALPWPTRLRSSRAMPPRTFRHRARGWFQAQCLPAGGSWL